ncbi:MAG: tRNA (adenosine(37)-N6)-dimethylallyltransferase MiaA [Chitinophagaceae bacterium]
MKTCIILLGPTAVGKTPVAIQLARHFKTDIISADSRQCYRELNIGVAKPSPQELAGVKHYFINSHSIHEPVNAALFEELALGWADEIFKRNDFVIMTGGTGLYIQAFCEGMDDIPSVSAEIRDEIIASFDEHGMDWLQQQVKEEDALYFEKGEMQNPQRLMRALEVKRSTGNSILSFRSSKSKERPFNIIRLGLDLPRPQLYERINHRVDNMMQQGLLQEAASLHEFRKLNALQTVGYTELFDHIDGQISLDKAVDLIKQHTRNYAKRQLTWFRKDDRVKWFTPGETDRIIQLI